MKQELDDDILTSDEVAKWLRVSTKWVLGRRHPYLPSVKLGRHDYPYIYRFRLRVLWFPAEALAEPALTVGVVVGK